MGLNFGFSTFLDSGPRMLPTLTNERDILNQRYSQVGASFSNFASSTFKYNLKASYLGQLWDWSLRTSESAQDRVLGHGLMSPQTLKQRYGEDINFTTPMGAIEAEGYVKRKKRLDNLDYISKSYRGDPNLGFIVATAGTILGNAPDMVASLALAQTLTVPLIAGLGGVATRSGVALAARSGLLASRAAGALKTTGAVLRNPYVADTLGIALESVATDPLYGKLAVDSGMIREEQYGEFVRNNMLVNIGVGSVLSAGGQFLASRAGKATPTSRDTGTRLSAEINAKVREAYGFEDIDTRPIEAELDARSRGYLSKTDLSDSSFSSLLPSNKTVGDVLFDGKINEALAEIELQGQRVSVLAESPNGFKTALKDLLDEGATPDEVVRALEAYDTIGGDTPSRFQELVEEGLEDDELTSVGAVMESYFSKKERLQGLVREEAALDASDAFRLGDSSDSLLGVQEQVLPSNRSFRGGDSDVLQSTEAKIRAFVERDAYDKTPEERQKIADAMLTAARSEAIKTLDQPDVMESLLGVSWEGTVPPDSKSVAQLFSQPQEVIEAAINCLTKEF